MPPSPTEEDTKRRQQEADAYFQQVGSFSFSDFVMFAAATLAVFGAAFKQDVMTLLAALLVVSAKFRIMFYGWAKFGIWWGLLIYVVATSAVLGVFAYADNKFWKWLSWTL